MDEKTRALCQETLNIMCDYILSKVEADPRYYPFMPDMEFRQLALEIICSGAPTIQ